MDKKNIENIYPLTGMQEALLFHHLQLGKADGGFLQMSFTLEGELQIEALKKSWQMVIERHSALRTAVFWENIEKPLQVVARQVSELPWTYEDWRSFSPNLQQEKLDDFYLNDREKGFDFTKSPTIRLSLFELGVGNYRFIWSCHHMLLDGWSGALVLKEVFDYYNSYAKGNTLVLEKPPSYGEYITWLQAQDIGKAKEYWQQRLSGSKGAVPFQMKKITKGGQETSGYKIEEIHLNQEHARVLEKFAKQQRVTLNIIFQGAWALILSQGNGEEHATFGVAVSGRPNALDKVDSVVGIFTNILPFKVEISSSMALQTWFQGLQEQQIEMNQFDYASPAQIQKWSNIPGHQRLFESIIIFENYPWTSFLTDNHHKLKITDFLGGVTTHYPLNLLVRPNFGFSIQVIYKAQLFSSQTVKLLLKLFQDVLQQMVSSLHSTVPDLREFVQSNKYFKSLQEPLNTTQLNTENIQDESGHETNNLKKALPVVQPRDRFERKNKAIWESLLGIKPISITSNFFELGGTSMLVSRLLQEVDKGFGHQVPFSAFFQAPTIEKLSNLLKMKEAPETGSSLVNIRSCSKKPPLLFYGVSHSYKLAKHISQEVPIYGIVPQELKGARTSQSMLEKIASHYVSEIMEKFPQGICALGGYCWGGMVVFEVAQQLHRKGISIPLLVLIETTFKIPRKLYLSHLIRRRIIDHIRLFLELSSREKVIYLRDDIGRGIKEKFSSITRRVLRLKNKKAKKYANKQLAQLDAVVDYTPAPYPGRTVVFYGEANKVIHLDDPRRIVWGNLVKNGLDIQNTAGKSSETLEEPNIGILASKIQGFLNSTLEHKDKILT